MTKLNKRATLIQTLQGVISHYLSFKITFRKVILTNLILKHLKDHSLAKNRYRRESSLR